MADETENTEIEETSDEAQAEDVVEETAPEVEEPAAEAEPVAEAEAEAERRARAPRSPHPRRKRRPTSRSRWLPRPAESLLPKRTRQRPPTTLHAEAEEAPPAEVVAAVSGPKLKKKRPPRSERPKKTRPKRVPAAERKSITRLPKPEHERGRRQERQGTVVSAASDKTIVVRVDTVKVHPRYKKVIKRSTRLHAHDEENQAKLGDVVRIIETRPLSRMKRWRLQEIVEVAK